MYIQYIKLPYTRTINDKPLVVDGEKIKMAHGPDGLHYLLIEKAGPEHAGKLAIIASNDNGNTMSEAKLSVTCKLTFFLYFIGVMDIKLINLFLIFKL